MSWVERAGRDMAERPRQCPLAMAEEEKEKEVVWISRVVLAVEERTKRKRQKEGDSQVLKELAMNAVNKK